MDKQKLAAFDHALTVLDRIYKQELKNLTLEENINIVVILLASLKHFSNINPEDVAKIATRYKEQVLDKLPKTKKESNTTNFPFKDKFVN